MVGRWRPTAKSEKHVQTHGDAANAVLVPCGVQRRPRDVVADPLHNVIARLTITKSPDVRHPLLIHELINTASYTSGQRANSSVAVAPTHTLVGVVPAVEKVPQLGACFAAVLVAHMHRSRPRHACGMHCMFSPKQSADVACVTRSIEFRFAGLPALPASALTSCTPTLAGRLPCW